MGGDNAHLVFLALALVQTQYRRARRLEIEKQFPQRYVTVSRLCTESIPDDGAQGEPQQHEPNTKQTEEGTEPKKEFHDTKNVIEKRQNQALCSFARHALVKLRVQTSRRCVDMADHLPRSTDSAAEHTQPHYTTDVRP